LTLSTAGPATGDWLQGLAAEASAPPGARDAAILDDLTQAYEKTLIEVALRHTLGAVSRLPTCWGGGAIR